MSVSMDDNFFSSPILLFSRVKDFFSVVNLVEHGDICRNYWNGKNKQDWKYFKSKSACWAELNWD